MAQEYGEIGLGAGAVGKAAGTAAEISKRHHDRRRRDEARGRCSTAR